MAGWSPLDAMAEQTAALQDLSRSDVRGQADRARAILLILQGWTSPRVAEAFGMRWFAFFGSPALCAARQSR